MTDTVPIVIRLRLPDGREFDCHSLVPLEYAENQYFWWTDGNGSCDCNRSLYLNREHDLNIGDDYGYDVPNMRCGDTIALVSLKVDGVEVFAENAGADGN